MPVSAALFVLALLFGGASGVAAQDAGSPAWFEVETLNEGLGPTPASIDRTTPRSSVESFLIEARDENWLAAAQMLDLSDIPVAEQREEGQRRAQDFLILLERKIIIDWYALRDRPDGLDERGGDGAMIGKPRRSILLWYVDLEDRPLPIRINRVKSVDGEPVWVVARQTVDNLPELGAAYGPSELELMLPETWRAPGFFGLRWWEAVAVPIVVLITLRAGRILHGAISALSRRSTLLTTEALLVATRGPVGLVGMTFALAMLSQRMFTFSGRIDSVLSPLIVIGAVVSVLWFVVNIADAIVSRLVNFDGAELSEIGEGQELRRDMATRVSAIRRGMIVVIAMVGSGIVLNEASVMQSLGISLLASAGTLTLVAAYAARDILSNIMASLQISINQSARIGDKIEFRGNLCSVERINFTYVQLRIWTGKRLVVPVVDFVSEPFENWTMQEPFMLGEVTLRLRHDADIEPLRARYHEILDGMEDTDEPDSRGCYVTDHDVFGQHVLFLVPCPNPNTAWALTCEVREKLLVAARRIDAKGKGLFPKVEAAEAA
ncbi:MAG: mechanosensitive ion channel family protein [Rhodobacterales bacterium]